MIIKSIEDVKEFNLSSEIPFLIYRGQTNTDWPLVPKLFREIPNIQNSARFELACFRPYLNNRARFFINYNSPIEHLINLQHYDGSTRLLDFTNNFYTSIFFACYDPFLNNRDKNGKVFVLHRDFFSKYYSVFSVRIPFIGFLSKKTVNTHHKTLNSTPWLKIKLA